MASQEEPFRKESEKGRIDISEPVSLDDGKLRSLIRLLCKYDEEMAKSFQSAPLNATYLSHDIICEILHMCSNHVLGETLARIKKAKCWSLLGDEAGRFHRDFLTVIIRYVDENLTIRVSIKLLFMTTITFYLLGRLNWIRKSRKENRPGFGRSFFSGFTEM